MVKYIRATTDNDVEQQAQEILRSGDAYGMLGRLESDCRYFLGNGNRYVGHLWAKDVDDQIQLMRLIYNGLKEKPDWISEQDIDRYESLMKTNPADYVTFDTVIEDWETKFYPYGTPSHPRFYDTTFRELYYALCSQDISKLEIDSMTPNEIARWTPTVGGDNPVYEALSQLVGVPEYELVSMWYNLSAAKEF